LAGLVRRLLGFGTGPIDGVEVERRRLAADPTRAVKELVRRGALFVERDALPQLSL
jgi:hypothetical protein